MKDRLLVALILMTVVALAFAFHVFFLLPILVCAVGLWEWWPLSKHPACAPWMRVGVPLVFLILPTASVLGLGDDGALGLVILVALTDTVAYFAGRRYGRHKLAPTISPGKTWEGFAAGVLLAPAAVALSLSFFQGPPLFSFPQFILLALLSQMGDLMESKLKRHLGIKDTGTWLRGHGGIMDRVDGFILAAPVAWLLSV